MALYSKKDIESTLRNLEYDTPNILEGRWYGIADFSNIGLCFAESKVVNTPLNIVQERTHNQKFFNHHTIYMDVNDLLDKFLAGLKIDINPLYKINNISPHIDYEPSFIVKE